MAGRRRIDIGPFAHRHGPLELWWEEPRDVERVVLSFPPGKTPAAGRVGLSYWRSSWPSERWERAASKDVGRLGWSRMDDWFNGEYRPAAVVAKKTAGTLRLSFSPLTREFPEEGAYAVNFRRTMKLRVELPKGSPAPQEIAVFTRSPRREIELRVEWRDMPARSGRLEPYNCEVRSTRFRGRKLALTPDGRWSLPQGGKSREVRMNLAVMEASPYSGDAPRLTLQWGEDGFTFDPREADRGERIFVPHLGVLVTRADDEASYAEVEEAVSRGERTLHARVLDRTEQTLTRALDGMPAPDLTYYFVGCKHSPFKFRIDPNGDVTVGRHGQYETVDGRVPPGRFWKLAFGLGELSFRGRSLLDGGLPVLTTVFGDGPTTVEETVLAAPLLRSILDGEPPSGAPLVCMVRFVFRNEGDEPAAVAFRLVGSAAPGEPDVLRADGRAVWAETAQGRRLRFSLSKEGAGKLSAEGLRLAYRVEVPAGGTVETVFKIPAGLGDDAETLRALDAKEFGREEEQVREYWREATRLGCELRTGEPRLDEFHRSHLAHVFITDDRMPDGELVNTCVGTFAYGNYPNESCMIMNDLDGRGLFEEARRRLEVYLRYQGTAALPGAFTDTDGLFYGCGGYECGGYNQHHGWVLWCLGEHYRLTGDAAWLLSAADKIVSGCDWIVRQRGNTKEAAPGVWEYGFLPAGALEDVQDFFCWLSTNALTWWGMDSAARALAEVGHPDGERLVREADAFGDDLREGFARSRRYSAVVKLRDGSWVPHFPSRLYLRGRDYGWIREVLEGALYLLFTRLIDPSSPEGTWILQDYEDNRYVRPPWGYPLYRFEAEWFDLGGFSMQPNLLPGPVPYLDRDEIEHFLRAYFNSFASCYRPDLNLLVEHPLPTLGATGGSHFKTSDEANSTRWLRSMFVCTLGDELHVGRAVPRAWFTRGRKMWLRGAATRFGKVSVEFDPVSPDGRMTCRLELEPRRAPSRVLVRFRHPEKRRMTGAALNGAPHEDFDPGKEWVILRTASPQVSVEAFFS